MLKSQEDRMLTLIITVWLECLRWSLLKSIVTTAEGISQSGFNIVNSLSLSLQYPYHLCLLSHSSKREWYGKPFI